MAVYNVNGYEINKWQNFANGALAVGVKDGRKYVLKRYPFRYPGADAEKKNPKLYSEKYKRASSVKAQLDRILISMRQISRIEGNLNIPVEIFVEDCSIYKVTRFIKACDLAITDVHFALDAEQIDILMKSVLMQAAVLEKMKFVHCDYKSDNVLIAKTGTKIYIGHVIDYDSGFFVGEAPDADNIVYSPEYASPELVKYIMYGESAKQNENNCLTCANDIFSLGILFHQYLTGETPLVVDKRGRTVENLSGPGEALLRGCRPVLSAKTDRRHKAVIGKMLAARQTERPTALQLIADINSI